MTINRYRYFYACAFDMYGDHLFAFVDRMAELDHAESTVKLYLSCINDVAKAMATARNAACDLDEKRALELVAAMGWIKSRETYARFMWWPRIRRGAVRAARCLLDLLAPAQRVLAADGEVAGGADSFLVIFRFGATLELGRSERTTMRPLWSYRVDAANTPDRKPR